MKKLAKSAVAAILGHQIKQLYKKNNFKVIGVAGSIGKTSTKLATAQLLSAGFKVRYQEGNYNDLVSVPLIFFGEEMPSLYNPLAWAAVFRRNAKQLKKPYQFDVVVVELGSDEPGQIAAFKRYLKLEIAVVTAITPEHMQNFDSMEAVANEEVAIKDFSSLIIANRDLIDGKYLEGLPNTLTYGLKDGDYNLSIIEDGSGLSEPEQYSRIAACAVAGKMGMDKDAMAKGLAKISDVPGRMRKLAGINNSTIIDDSYNASPDAVKLALRYFYRLQAPQKIALLGNMNELGATSAAAHKEIGSLCDPRQLELVVTLGPDANKYLAPAAEAQGCSVKSFDSPYEAGEYIKRNIRKGAIILVKGSQNGVYAEEAVKSFLAEEEDKDKLVRQNPEWMKIKRKAFKT